MKKWFIGIIVLILILSITFAVINFNKKLVGCPKVESKNCTEGQRFLITDSNNCEISICKEELIAKCNSVGGSWTEFSDSCADKCGLWASCGQAFVNSCDCGPDKCWDEKSLTCKSD